MFGRSVVLLLYYDTNDAVGSIINQQTSLQLAELFPDVAGTDGRADRVYLGGPVSPTNIGFLVQGESKLPDLRLLVDGVHFRGSRRALEQVLERGTPVNRFHVYVGYAGWGAGQLDGELERGDWWVAPAEAELVFDENPDELLGKLFFRLGRASGRPGRGHHWDVASARRQATVGSMSGLDYFTFIVLAVLVVAGLSLAFVLGELPGRIAERRQHPQSEAIRVAGWLGLLTLGVLWPFALIWAYTRPSVPDEIIAPHESLERLADRVAALERDRERSPRAKAADS